MELAKRLCLLLLGLAVATEMPVLAKLEYLDTVHWSGVSFYIPVSRQALQEKLDRFHDNASGLRLYLPDASPLPNFPENTLPLYVEFGTMTVYDALESETGEHMDIAPSKVELTTSIPFLSLSPGGSRHVSLTLAIFRDPSRGSFPEFALLPYTDVDDIQLDGDEFTMTKGEDQVRIKYTMPRPCNPISSVVTADFDAFMNEDTNFSPKPPTFAYCNQMPLEDRFCKKVAAFKDEVLDAYPDVCEHWHSTDGKSCEASVEVVEIADWFWDAIPVTQAVGIHVVEAEGYIGHFKISIKYPCI